ncbi:hypothetical protein PUNSTDRAFT_135350 [Punctularia strigosozonata HHB-11173 SS5]|uniref:uncharacterized protein n=1 Tax=Punctularia strigosozonata (strain HHB-11173) TaxID=741275 RepID=UPI0004417E3C|nr:uncharacterized protein PUNSTDRAFT_135350 [Punctularia strigosozonata HHB-11173 SS5]EIN07834.1 hypothetical protein PUNSTDRAFT_135350 [Punctularia strigosozonata HHB-11173 SS5]
MNVSFTRDSVENATIVDSATGREIFELSTHSSTTTLRDIQSGVVVGAVEWHTFHKNRVTIRDERAELDEWLHTASWLHSSRTFRAPNGIEYKWKGSDGKWHLIDQNSAFTVVQSHNAHSGILHKAQRMNLDVDASVLPFLDVIVLTYAIMEKMDRESPPPAPPAF